MEKSINLQDYRNFRWYLYTMKYWTEDTDKELIRFNLAETQEERDNIYSQSLHIPCSKIVENVLNTFKNVDYIKETDIYSDTLGYLVRQLQNFKSEYGKGFSYATVITKRYLIRLNMDGYKDHNRHITIEADPEDEDAKGIILESKEKPEIDLNTFAELMFEWFLVHYPEMGDDPNILPVITAMQSAEGSKKTDILAHIRKETGLSNVHIRKVINILKPVQKALLKSYVESGELHYTFSAPRSPNNFAPETIQEIQSLYGTGNYTYEALAKQYNCSKTTIGEMCRGITKEKKSKLSITRDKNPKLSLETIKEIQSLYQSGNYTYEALAKQYNSSKKMIGELCKDICKGWRKNIRKEVMNLYKTGNYTYEALAKQYNISHTSVRRFCQSFTSPQIRQKIISLYETGNFTYKALARKYRCSYATIERICKNSSLKKKVRLGFEKAKEIRCKYDAGMETAALMAEYRVTRISIFHLLHNRTWHDPDYVAKPLRRWVGTKIRLARLNDEKVREIYHKRWLENISVSQLSKEYGVNTRHIRKICAGKAWRHATKDLIHQRQLDLLEKKSR